MVVRVLVQYSRGLLGRGWSGVSGGASVLLWNSTLTWLFLIIWCGSSVGCLAVIRSVLGCWYSIPGGY